MPALLLFVEPVNPLPDMLPPERNRLPDDPLEIVPDLPIEEPVGTFVPPVADGGLRIVVVPADLFLDDDTEAPLLFEVPVGVLRPANGGMKVVDVLPDPDRSDGACVPPDFELPELT
ncbi:MAG: hypothetical protein GX616_09135 [Planctomycetes bacterium]|nr:hypothetical protein [Planctomycetota bacterium]